MEDETQDVELETPTEYTSQSVEALVGTGKSAIAERLNQEGFVPPRRRGVFSVGTVAPIMERLGLVGELYRNDLLGLTTRLRPHQR